MATNKTASSAKKSTSKKTSTSKVTTVKAVSAKKPSSTLFGLKLSRSPLLGSGIAEFVGTFLLAAGVLAAQGQPVLILFAAVGVALTVAAMSGAYLNPATTIAAWATRKMKASRALVYIVAQVLGAMLALVALNAFASAAPQPTGEAAMYGQAVAVYKSAAIPADHQLTVFFAELLGASLFGFAFAAALKQRDRLTSAFTFGLGLFAALMVAGFAASVVGASTILNPAVAVALQAVNFTNIWPFAIYIFATSLGALLGFILNDLLSVESDGDGRIA